MSIKSTLLIWTRGCLGQSGLLPFDESQKGEFSPEGWKSYVDRMSDIADEVFLEGSKSSSERSIRPAKILPQDVDSGLLRVIFRRAYRRRGGIGPVILKLIWGACAGLAGFFCNQAAATNPTPDAIRNAIIFGLFAILLGILDYLLAVKP